ncbi:amidohydrolase 2 [Mycobacterium lentiflavum]|uniref:Amidohydrolase 2 n=2 Tax=Mycobacterium lentiflavum TaxID=141349 RepID=A0A0E4GX08_MYCLN|nr:amidohydrolase 2 [Mycobacterium lentiflavum]
MASKWGELIPRIKRNHDHQADEWYIGDHSVSNLALTVMFNEQNDDRPHRRKDDFPASPQFIEEVHPSSWDPVERAKVMDSYGINMAALYPNLGLTSPDHYRLIPGATVEFQLELIAAFNDFVLSWAQRAPGRFIPLAVIPYWDLNGCIKEIERCVELGHKGFVMSGTPEYHDCPVLSSRHWDPLWAAANATNLPIAFHAGTSTNVEDFVAMMERERDGGADNQRIPGGNNVTAIIGVFKTFLDNIMATANLIMSGVPSRYPDLKFAIVESGSGWVPFALESLDVHFKRYRPWETRQGLRKDDLPSDIFRRQIFVNTWYEQVRPDDLALLPVDNIMFESDYPHPTCLMDDEVSHSVTSLLSDLSEEDREKISYKNAMRCFDLAPGDIGRIARDDPRSELAGNTH